MTTQTLKQAITLAIASTAMALGAASSATAASLVPGNITDNQFSQLMASGQFTETFVTSSRIGAAGASDYELGILDPQNNLLPDQQQQFGWTSGDVVDFSLTYDGSTVDYRVGDQLLSSTTFSGPVTDLFFRTRAADESSVQLSNLVLTDDTGSLNLGSFGSTGIGGRDVDYLQLTDVTGAFEISGQSVLSWTSDAPPRGSALIYQIKAGTAQSVPEPASLAAIALVGAAGLKLRRRRG